MTQKIIHFEEIKKVLPHRYPFLLVDRVLSVTESSIRAMKNVTANEPFFMGHFPDMAVMPGVLQVEAMAQAAGLILALGGGFDVWHFGRIGARLIAHLFDSIAELVVVIVPGLLQLLGVRLGRLCDQCDYWNE